MHNDCGEDAAIYRGGGRTTPRIDKVRVNKDVFPDKDGLIYPGKGGISLDTSRDNLVNSGFHNPWKGSAGDLPEGLQLRNDHDTHVLLEPSRPMAVDEFIELLRKTRWEKDF